MKRVVVPILVLLAALVGAVMLDRPQPSAEFTMVDSDEVFTLDPQRMSWMQDFRMAYALYEPLVRWNNDDFTFEPAACVDLPDVSDDQLTYTFHLREDAKWSNGAPVTAHDFAYSWMRALLPDTAADYTMMFYCIAGAPEFFNWRSAQTRQLSDLHTDTARSAEVDGFNTTSDAALQLWRDTEARFRDTVGIRAIDDRTLEVTLARPTPYFLDLIAFGVFHPVYRPCVEGWVIDDEPTRQRMIRDGWHTINPPPFEKRRFARINESSGTFEQKHAWTKPEELITNGPYVLTDWRYKRGMRLELNPFYHTPDMVRSRSVNIISISDSNTAVLAFERGQIDWLADVQTEYQADLVAERLRYEAHYSDELAAPRAKGMSLDDALASLPPPQAGERRNVHVYPTFGTDFYSFNCRPRLNDGRPNVFFDKRVRRAFVLATDRKAIVTQVTRLNEPVVTSLIPPDSIPGYTYVEGLGYNPESAREELRQAGWEDRDEDGLIEDAEGRPFPTVDLLYSTNTPRYVNISQALRDMWQRELGVRVELRGKENKSFKEDLRSGNFMVGRGRWYGDYGDPTTFLDICKTGDGNNDRGYSNAYVDDLLAQASVETDPGKRMELLQECERYLFQEDPPMLVLCNLVQLYMYEPGSERGVTGLSRHPRLSQYVWELKRH